MGDASSSQVVLQESGSDTINELKAEVERLTAELRRERGFLPPKWAPYRAQTWGEYVRLPFKQTNSVALRQIGTQHGPLDVVLCTILGLPGLAFALTLDSIDCRVRALVAAEAAVVATISTIGDGFLIQSVLEVDKRISAPLHVVIWIGLLAWLAAVGQVHPAAVVALALTGVATLAIFHARMYWTTVAQDPVASRTCARLWHVAATVVPAGLVVAVALND